jgi:hypothetical protein
LRAKCRGRVELARRIVELVADASPHPSPATVLVLTHSLHKEEATYGQEVAEATAQLEKLKAAGADGADIRNAVSWPGCEYDGLQPVERSISLMHGPAV